MRYLCPDGQPEYARILHTSLANAISPAINRELPGPPVSPSCRPVL